MYNIDCWKVPKDLDKILKEHNGPIITRFPPENSGYLHIGHVKALMINYVIAKRYNGQMILRFDDTNPVTESLEYENAITEDINTLGIIPNTTSYSSDYFPQLLQFAEQLLQNHKAYVDNTEQLVMKSQRKKGIESSNRNNTIEENIKLFNLMKVGLLKDSCVRIKFSMNHSIPNCRDPVIFRSIDKLHHRTNDTYKIYPTYDFTCPIVDSLEQVTHAFRSVEYSDRSEQYNLMLSALNLRKPKLFCYGKVKFVDVVLSKRKIKLLIDNNTVSGWDDPRLFTLRGLLNRGINLNALNQFVSTLGFSSKTPPIMTPDKLFTMNRKTVDMLAGRYFCLPTNSFTAIKVNNINVFNNEIPKYIKNLDLGMRTLNYNDTILINTNDYDSLKENEEISLMLWTNAFVNSNNLTLNPTGAFKNTEKRIVWISSKNTVDVRLDYCVKYEPIKSNYYVGEESLLKLNKGDYVQFIKMNYYMCTEVDLDKNFVSFIELS